MHFVKLPTPDGVKLINLDNVLLCKERDWYSVLVLSDGSEVIVDLRLDELIGVIRLVEKSDDR